MGVGGEDLGLHNIVTVIIICCLFLGMGGGLPWWLSGKESAANAEDMGSLPGLGRPSGEGNGNPLQHSCLENPMDRGIWGSPWGRKVSDTAEQLSTQHRSVKK